MTVLLTAVALVAGIWLGGRLLAALYGPLDLWYSFQTAWPSVLGRIVFWLSLIHI